ncbi:hypothetical protein [Paenibacillus xylanexedens]|uniref:hypothetical protein n=1 Tax=Paenibacillus xylanexedens TaxID=528191 RepID=UPI0011AA6FE9|nr:hypothetical protein [Paenibacillus xylanexedens]
MNVYIATFSSFTLDEKYCIVSAGSEEEAKKAVISELNRNEYGVDEEDIILKDFDTNETNAVLIE